MPDTQEQVVSFPEAKDRDWANVEIRFRDGMYRVIVDGKHLQSVTKVEFEMSPEQVPIVKLHVIALDMLLTLDQSDTTIYARNMPSEFGPRRIVALTQQEQQERDA